ncbi:MAG: hypothetical protein RBU21_05695 [FCB group bacterium]|jgi:type II secretory pathway pseudopilin PulG|nr:hypothetical protein [FCB group bacterium]
MRRRHGYILVEAVAAIAVLSLGIVGVQEAMRQSILTRAQARDLTQARFLLEELVGQLQLRPQLAEGGRKGDYGENYPRFRWEYKVSRIQLPEADQPVPNEIGPDGKPLMLELPVKFMVAIDVTITWTQRGNEYKRSTRTLCQPEKMLGYDAKES